MNRCANRAAPPGGAGVADVALTSRPRHLAPAPSSPFRPRCFEIGSSDGPSMSGGEEGGGEEMMKM